MSTYSVAFIECDGLTPGYGYSCALTFDSGKRSVTETREDAGIQGWATARKAPRMRALADYCPEHAPKA